MVPYAGHEWEVDVFGGTLDGVVWPEIEIGHEDETFERPDWVGQEVTGDPRFRHANLLRLCEGERGAANLADLLADTAERTKRE